MSKPITDEQIIKLSDNELNWKLFGQCFQTKMDLYAKLNQEKGKRIKAGTWSEKS